MSFNTAPILNDTQHYCHYKACRKRLDFKIHTHDNTKTQYCFFFSGFLLLLLHRARYSRPFFIAALVEREKKQHFERGKARSRKKKRKNSCWWGTTTIGGK
jgi:hypothetical protein